jgi:hypothetical protein
MPSGPGVVEVVAALWVVDVDAVWDVVAAPVEAELEPQPAAINATAAMSRPTRRLRAGSARCMVEICRHEVSLLVRGMRTT